MYDFQSTRQVAEDLDVTPGQLFYAMRLGTMDRPRRSPWGYFLWRPADVRRVQGALCLVRPYRPKAKA